MLELAYPLAVVLLGITGFGSALIIVPLLAWRCCWTCLRPCCGAA